MPNTLTTLPAHLLPAVEAVRTACRVCQAVRSRLVTPETITKKDKSPVTVADYASQAVVASLLGDALPMVGEEDAAALRSSDQASVLAVVVEQVSQGLGRKVSSGEVLAWIDRGGHDARPGEGGRYWTLDPIDGTKGFLRGEQYAVALGLIEQGEVTAAVLGCPNYGQAGGLILVAVKGHGAASLSAVGDARLTPVRVSPITDASQARFCESVESGHSDQSRSSLIAGRLGITAEPARMDSQCKYAAVARGDASIYLRLPTQAGYEEKIWDHAAGMLVVAEAGGRVTDIDGKPLDFGRGKTLAANRGIVATCGPIHDAVLDAVRATA